MIYEDVESYFQQKIPTDILRIRYYEAYSSHSGKSFGIKYPFTENVAAHKLQKAALLMLCIKALFVHPLPSVPAQASNTRRMLLTVQ